MHRDNFSVFHNQEENEMKTTHCLSLVYGMMHSKVATFDVPGMLHVRAGN